MAENWPWDASSQGMSAHSNYWPAPQHPPPSSSSNYGNEQFAPVQQVMPNLPIHHSFYEVRSRVDPTFPTPALQQHDDDGLDEFDRHLLRMSDLPAAHPQSGRRLTLHPSQPHMVPAGHTSAQIFDHSADPFYIGQQHSVQGFSLYQQHSGFTDLSEAVGTVPVQEEYLQHGDLCHAMQRQPPRTQSASFPYAQAERPMTPPSVRTSFNAVSLSPTAAISFRKQRQSQAISQRDQTSSMSDHRQEAAQYSLSGSAAPPIVRGIQLLSPRQVLPDELAFQSIFPFEVFNAVQSKCFPSAYGSTDNLVVAAPTGSGKTAILELAICRIIKDNTGENVKIVYQAPTKALCSEKAREWEKKFSCLKLEVAELTGDTSQAEMRRVGQASIIVTTPEKWDSITRKWHDHKKLLQLVGLFLIDEVHILKDIRGATLEAVVSRMKAIGNNVRFVALSATVPNSEDIATWLGRNHEDQQQPALQHTFGPEFRPVKLERHIFGYEKRTNDHVFDKFLDSKLPGLLNKHTAGKPILVFCFTRKSCENTAAKLASLPIAERAWKDPPTPIRVVTRELQQVVKYGVAYHHAGLGLEDRQIIEKAFLRGDLGVICCTSTLAVGVNLPCHTVVLKGTVAYQNDSIQELSDLEVMQMLGRAGRPQFDDTANALILTSTDQKERYERMVAGEEILESTLHLNLIEHLNSEIGLRTITDMASAKRWLAGTFLSVRMQKNPGYYRLTEAATANTTASMLKNICERDISLLQEYKIITCDPVIRQTEYGVAMARYMVEFDTMKLLLELPRALTMQQLLNALSKAHEFKEYKFKPADGPIFREVNKSPFILYPIEEHISKTWHKISLVVQLHLGAADFPDSSDGQKQRNQLRMEKKGIFERLQRLVRCVAECKGNDRDSVSTKTALELARSLAAGAWEGRASELLQIPTIGPVNMRKLTAQGVKTVKDLVGKSYGELEHLLGRQPPTGKVLADKLKAFPLLHLDLAIPRRSEIRNTSEGLSVPVLATLRYLNATGIPQWDGKIPACTFVAETSAGLLCYFWRGSLRKFENDKGLELHFAANITAQAQRIICHFSCEQIVGTVVTKTLDHGIPILSFHRIVSEVEADIRARATTGVDGAIAEEKTSSTYRNVLAHEKDVGSPGGNDSEAAQPLQPNAKEDFTVIQKHDSQVSAETNYGEDDFPMVEEILEVMSPRGHCVQPGTTIATAKPTKASTNSPKPLTPATMRSSSDPTGQGDGSDKEPVRLPNGKYQCNHACTGGAPTKAGKKCTHRCCIDGLDKPRKLKPKSSNSKKHKAEDPVHPPIQESSITPGSSSYSQQLGNTNKKQRLSRESGAGLESDSTSLRACQAKTSGSTAIGAMKQQLEPGSDHYIASPSLDGEDEFPDVAVLATSRSRPKEAASKNTEQGIIAKLPRSNTSFRGYSTLSVEDYLPCIPRQKTADYGSLSDDFGDDSDLDMLAVGQFGYREPSNDQVKVTPSFHAPRTTDGALRDGAQAKVMLGGGTGPACETLQDLSPSAYQKALHDAAKLCDIGSQDSARQYDEDTPPPDDYNFCSSNVMFDSDNTAAAGGGPTLGDVDPADDKLDNNLGVRYEQLGNDAPLESSTASLEEQKKEPAWVQEFDQDFIDQYRGLVNFVE